MKVTRSLIGSLVKITWEDPRDSERLEIATAPKGRSALAKWHEYGIIDDITEGVVRIRHSEAFEPGESRPDEGVFGWLPEELIKSVEVASFEQLKTEDN